MATTPGEEQFISTLLAAGGPSTVVFIVGLMREWWYMGSQYRALEARLEAMTKDRDFWREVSMVGSHLAHQAVDAALRKED